MGNSCLTVSQQTTYKWTIDGFSSLLNKGKGWTYSGAFKIMDLNWYLMLNPRDKKSGDQNDYYVSMRLGLSKCSMKPGTIVEACFKFMIYDQFYGKHHEHRGLLCSQDTSCSPEFELGGYNWFIGMHPSDDGKHLSLFLNMRKANDLPKDSGSLVELTLSIIDQEGGKHRHASGRFSTNNNCKLGVEKLISLEDFKDASKGYLVKSKCCIEAKLEIVGSSRKG